MRSPEDTTPQHNSHPQQSGKSFLDDEELPPKVSRELAEGDVVTVETPGGGGCVQADDGR